MLKSYTISSSYINICIRWKCQLSTIIFLWITMKKTKIDFTEIVVPYICFRLFRGFLLVFPCNILITKNNLPNKLTKSNLLLEIILDVVKYPRYLFSKSRTQTRKTIKNNTLVVHWYTRSAQNLIRIDVVIKCRQHRGS